MPPHMETEKKDKNYCKSLRTNELASNTSTGPIDSVLTNRLSVNTALISSQGGTSAFLWESRENMYLAISGDQWLTVDFRTKGK